MARVRGVMCSATCSTFMVSVSASTSTNTGVAPQYRMPHTVPTKVLATVITSSPGPTSAARNAMCMADVPELQATACAAPQ